MRALCIIHKTIYNISQHQHIIYQYITPYHQIISNFFSKKRIFFLLNKKNIVFLQCISQLIHKKQTD